MKSKNILTVAIAVLAVAMAIVVVLLQTGVINKKPEEEETVIETKIVQVSETNEHGEIEYMTMVSEYSAPKVSSDYVYPVKPTEKPKPTEPTTVQYVEYTNIVEVLDENGNPVLDENGAPVTQIQVVTEVYTGETTIPPTTQYVPKTEFNVVTNAFGRPQKDENGNPLTQVVTVEPIPPEHQDIWGDESDTQTTRFPQVNITPQRDSTLANNIVTQIQADRANAGMPYLTVSDDLSAAAREDSHLRALNMHDEQSSGGAVFDTAYGGSAVYNDVKSALSTQYLSAEATQIGVGVMKINGKYFTTVIIR